MSSIYHADINDVEVQGSIQFAVNFIQKLGEFHIFVVQCNNLAVADNKKNRSDPWVLVVVVVVVAAVVVVDYDGEILIILGTTLT